MYILTCLHRPFYQLQPMLLASYIWNGTNRLHARASFVCFTLTTMS